MGIFQTRRVTQNSIRIFFQQPHCNTACTIHDSIVEGLKQFDKGGNGI